MRAGARSLIAAITICSWIAVSNHCAFAAVATQIDKAQTECPFHSKPAKQKEQSSHVRCCKVLRAVVFAKTKDWARDDAKFCDANFPAQAGTLLAYSPRAVAPLLLDTGPPGTFSFAELILQRILLAHAPPARLESRSSLRGARDCAAPLLAGKLPSRRALVCPSDTNGLHMREHTPAALVAGALALTATRRRVIAPHSASWGTRLRSARRPTARQASRKKRAELHLRHASRSHHGSSGKLSEMRDETCGGERKETPNVQRPTLNAQCIIPMSHPHDHTPSHDGHAMEM